MAGRDRSKPMPVKHWSFAGLLLTYWCNARCASCYVCSGPQAGGDADVESALALWEGLAAASPHGCRIHIGGGEPFGRWETLIELARRARAAGLGPLQAVETNAFWATDAATVRDRLAALDAAGMGRLTISADPYHQQFVPIERVRLAARVGEEVLGPGRVRLRWRDWAESGFDTDRLTATRRRELFAEFARRRRDRIAGRAADQLAAGLELMPARAFADISCRQPLLRSRHVHIDGDGIICPGTCAGIILGRGVSAASVGEIWRALSTAFADTNDSRTAPGAGQDRPARAGCFELVSLLAQSGPAALMNLAGEMGYRPRGEGYAARCHLCWDVRRWLFENGSFRDQLGPAVVYRP